MKGCVMSEAAAVLSIECACCGEARTEADVVRLHNRSEIAVCGQCVRWLSTRTSSAHPALTPILPVRDMTEAVDFWRRTGVEAERYDDGYTFLMMGGAELAHLALYRDLDAARNAAACYLHVADVASWHERWERAGLPVGSVEVRPWDMTEFQVRDPSGNLLRVGSPT